MQWDDWGARMAATPPLPPIEPSTVTRRLPYNGLARPVGLEPTTPGLEGALSEQMVNIG